MFTLSSLCVHVCVFLSHCELSLIYKISFCSVHYLKQCSQLSQGCIALEVRTVESELNPEAFARVLGAQGQKSISG